jgi:cob(I)alamin adenosyltransferase
MLILDEINNALQLKLIDLDQVLAILDNKPELLHLVITGRDAHEEVLSRADTASRVDEITHAYRKDIEPQPGIDY